MASEKLNQQPLAATLADVDSGLMQVGDTPAGATKRFKLLTLISYIFGAARTMLGTLTLRAGTTAAGTSPLKLPIGVLNTIPEVGAVEFAGKAIHWVNSAGDRLCTVGSHEDSILLADVIADNTIVETDLLTHTIPAGSISTGSVMLAVLDGICSKASNGHTGTLRIWLGATLLGSASVPTGAATDLPFHMEMEFTARTAGAAAPVRGHLHIGFEGLAVTSPAIISSIDTTIANDLRFSWEWGTAAIGTVATAHSGRVQNMC